MRNRTRPIPRGKCPDTDRSRNAPTLHLHDLANVGSATLRDFDLLGIRTVAQLARREPFALYRELCRRTGQRHDLCVIDVFLATISQARGGGPAPWWKFTAERKARLAEDPSLARFESHSR